MEEVRGAEQPEETADSTDVAHARELAGFWRRLAAACIDAILVAGAGFLLGFLFPETLASMGVWGRLLGLAVALGYYAIHNSCVCDGMTLGKRLLHIQVVGRDGKCVSLHRSALRFLVLGAPLFLSGITYPSPLGLTLGGLAAGVVVYGTAGALAYLYVSNRGTRQSLHDLAASTWVVRSWPEGEVESPPLWPGHLRVALGWAGAVFLVLMFQWHQAGYGRLQRAWNYLEEEPSLMAMGIQGIHAARGAFMGPGGGKPWLGLTAAFRRRPDFEAASDEIAGLVLTDRPDIHDEQFLLVTVTWGYDIGIFRQWEEHSFRRTPDEWEERLERLSASE